LGFFFSQTLPATLSFQRAVTEPHTAGMEPEVVGVVTIGIGDAVLVFQTEQVVATGTVVQIAVWAI